MISVLQIHPKDNVAVALRPLSKGELPSPLQFPLLDDIPAGHKIALQDIPAGGQNYKIWKSYRTCPKKHSARDACTYTECCL